MPDHLMRRADSLEKTLILGKKAKGEEDGRRMRRLENITDSMDKNVNKFWEIVKNRGAWYAAVHEVAKSQT